MTNQSKLLRKANALCKAIRQAREEASSFQAGRQNVSPMVRLAKTIVLQFSASK